MTQRKAIIKCNRDGHRWRSEPGQTNRHCARCGWNGIRYRNAPAPPKPEHDHAPTQIQETQSPLHREQT